MSGYRLIYPKEAPLDPGIYEKITKRAHEMFKEATGTVIKFRKDQIEIKKPKKKKSKKKKKRVSSSHPH